ncbi:MAG: TIGR03960 family B12-binding radical SAM protein [Candidatus Omnitrophica bacterium]|nr:TIGR03960 family B12-binding radical SAM protein [Candidatus Omnitrophota bacterium]MBU1128789.1 TIGR03960 family B12-binding radical SAM protein [Candidatus Omnitrophota bacterium]MBU1785210.1 TIGR03960 family B12-binding radical SAM protein [Candidatus Omnitrophota bacterium]MBU1851218.1 TIGR03960 family B12-binding radical SAM protein [Candidatus Omnitrophota bacterium]
MTKLTDMLDKVQKPGRYIGGETGARRKDFRPGRVSVALAYPDMYEIGMSYLGLKLLYHLLNERDDVVCERVFAPAHDMEKELVTSGIKLFSLESKTDINKFDIVGFSLSYELTYTNVLNMLNLSGITVLADQRGEDEPIIIAGGACCFNPEPMSRFIDVFFIGDAEETLPEFIEEYRKISLLSLTRKRKMKKLSLLKGVYVPCLYDAKYAGSRFDQIVPANGDVPRCVKKGEVKDLNSAYYPVKQLVPFIKIVHDRIVVEVMRGCPNKCRFCQASAINSPVRVRKPEMVRALCREAYKNTGYSQITLLSLSSVNYPYLADLVKGLNEDFKGRGVGISIPSLRVDEAFYEIPEIIAAERKAALTFAPEAANPDIQRSIGKKTDYDVLCQSARVAYRHGWQRLKLYFMVGFPGRIDAEVDDIMRWANDVSVLRKELQGRAADVKVSVNPFIPKPHTPFQWMGMAPEERLRETRRQLLARGSKRVKVEFHDIGRSILETCMSRGDRRIADVIYSAWRGGAKMDGWSDFFDLSIWEAAFKENGLDIRDEAQKTFSIAETLPWGHIKTGTSEACLKQEFVDSGFGS